MLRRSVHVKQLIEGQVEVVEGRGRRGKQLLHDLKKTKRYCKLKKKSMHQIALCGEMALEEIMDLSQDRLQNYYYYYEDDDDDDDVGEINSLYTVESGASCSLGLIRCTII